MGLNYEDGLTELRRALAFGINPSLDGITALCEELGRPQDAFDSVQVTGTNGKTSTARYIASLLQEEGVATALYTSPELQRYPERMEIGGAVVSDDEFAAAVSEALDASQRLRPGAQGSVAGFTEFELLTAAALWLFRERAARIAVLEVGMGGRWDATSVVSPKVAVITGVGLDHMAILGDTLEAIAAEKAAIIRPGAVAVLGPGTIGLEPVFLAAARSADAAVFTPGFEILARPHSPGGATVFDVVTSRFAYAGLAVHAPAYQAQNAATALVAAEAALGRVLEPVRAAEALAHTTLPGRFELLRRNPAVVVDGSHNPQAAAVLAEAIADAWPDPSRRPVVLLGILADKDAAGIVSALAPVVHGFAVTKPDSPRALPFAELAGIVDRVTGRAPQAFGDIGTALATLVTTAPDGLVITGSLTTAGQARADLVGSAV